MIDSDIGQIFIASMEIYEEDNEIIAYCKVGEDKQERIVIPREMAAMLPMAIQQVRSLK